MFDPTVSDQRVFEGLELPDKALFSDLSQWRAGGMEIRDNDVERARTLVEEGKADGWGGAMSSMGGDDQASRSQALAVPAMLENVGFIVETELILQLQGAPLGERVGVLGEIEELFRETLPVLVVAPGPVRATAGGRPRQENVHGSPRSTRAC